MEDFEQSDAGPDAERNSATSQGPHLTNEHFGQVGIQKGRRRRRARGHAVFDGYVGHDQSRAAHQDSTATSRISTSGSTASDCRSSQGAPAADDLLLSPPIVCADVPRSRCDSSSKACRAWARSGDASVRDKVATSRTFRRKDSVPIDGHGVISLGQRK